MLVESSFTSFVETSLLNVSEYQDPFSAYDWASLAETYQMIHTVPEQSQVSFLKAAPVTDAMNLDESKHPKDQASCSEKSAMHKVSEKALSSLVYRRRKRSFKPGGTSEHNLGKIRKQDDSLDDSIVSLHNPGESTKRKNRFKNCLVYSRKKRRRKSSCTFTEETTIRGDGLDDAFVSKHDCGQIRRRGRLSDNCLVYSRKKGRVKWKSCSFSEHVTGGTKISCDQADSSACSQRGQIFKADSALNEPNPGEIKQSGHQFVYSQSKQLVKSNGRLTASPSPLTGETTIRGDGLYDAFVSKHDCGEIRRRGKRSDNFLVSSRKKGRVKLNNCSFSEHVTGGTKISCDQADSSACSRRGQIFKADSALNGPNPGETKKSGHQSVYSQSKQLVKCIGSLTEKPSPLTGETTIRGDGLDDAFVSKHDCGEIRRRGKRSDNCLVYSRKKGRVKLNSCSFSEHVTGGTKISCDQADSSACSQRGQIFKADSALNGPNPGEIKKSGHQFVYSQSKQLVKSNGSFTESHIGVTKRNEDRSDVLLTYSRRKQRGKSIGVRVNGFLVYTRKKFKFRGPFARHDPNETKKYGGQLSIVSSPELVDNTQVTEGTCSSDPTNVSCSSLKSSSELDSSSSKTGEDDCYSSDAGVSKTDTDGNCSPFRQCKHCHKPGTGEKMLICDKCEEAYHASCCGVRMKEISEIDDWLCPSCLKNKSSKTKIKGRIARERKWRVTVPVVTGIRIGKEFQADVPEWSGPTMSDTAFVGEPLEIGQSEYMHDLKKAKNRKKKCSAVNWLQCREEDTNGDICGKWRRALRSEVQTKDWECFCCVFWDPSCADCAVPQELETSEILKQLKYIKMLRPRSNAKKGKLGLKGRNRSHNKERS